MVIRNRGGLGSKADPVRLGLVDGVIERDPYSLTFGTGSVKSDRRVPGRQRSDTESRNGSRRKKHLPPRSSATGKPHGEKKN